MDIYLSFSFFLFLIGVCGLFFIYLHFIKVLICFEIMLLAANINFVISSVFFDDLVGQLYSLFILTIAAGETALGLAYITIYYRIRGIIALSLINMLKK